MQSNLLARPPYKMLADTARDLLVNFDKPLLHPRRMSITKAHHIKKKFKLPGKEWR